MALADRRHRAYDVLAEHRPDLVFRQELTHAHLDGSRALYEEANRLGLWPFMAAGTPESVNPTGVLLSTELFQVDAYYTHATGGWHPICNPLVRLKTRATVRQSAVAGQRPSVLLRPRDPGP
ncbi:hypothetical protein ACGFMO_32625 [Streptomyces niveus]|uniref:hypothetical protein n=1 Tax=Streptomyces niveus TaxID=193462 RepID=UPI00371B3632